MKLEFIEVVLTCGSWQEAQGIADELLAKHLVACVEFMEVRSKNWWKGALEESKEIKLIMQSLGAHFAAVETVVKALHTYEVPNLHALPITYITDQAADWLTTGNKLD
jgi:periplasmic divalent cation tolerance protein